MVTARADAYAIPQGSDLITGDPVGATPPPPPPPAPSITLSSTGAATAGSAYAVTVTAANLTGPLTVTPERVSGPAATFDPATVLLSPGELVKLFNLTAAAAGTLRLRATAAGGIVSNERDVAVNAAPSPGPTPPPPPPAPSQPFRVVRTGTRYATLAQAVAGAISGDTITVSAGTYVIPAGPGEQTTPGNTFVSGGIQLNTLTIEWETPGVQPIIDQSAFANNQGNTGGRPIGIYAGNNNRSLTVRGLVLIGDAAGDSYGIASDAGFPSGNPTSTLTIEYCKLVRWADGVKTTYANQALSVNLRYSTIEDCTGNSLTHGIYVQGDTVDVLGCTFRTTVAGLQPAPAFAGHLLKSRMKTTIVRGCLFDMKGGGAACIEAPNGGTLTVEGNIILKYNVGDASNPPIKYGFEESALRMVVDHGAAAPFVVNDVVVGATSGASVTITHVLAGSTYVYRLNTGGQYLGTPPESVTVGGVARGTITSKLGSPDGTSNDGRTHLVNVSQNTIRNEQPSSWGGTTATAIGALWISANMTTDAGVPISNSSIVGNVRNNIIGDIGTGNRTVANISPEPQHANNSPVEAATLATTGTLGVYSGAPIAGSPNVNDAEYAYAGEFTPPLARTDTFRGGRIEGLPTWAEGRTALRWFSITPTNTLAEVDPRLDGALNQNGAGNTPPWHNASNPQAQMLNAWGGGAYNRVSKKLVTHGGGHLGYEGNELYSINMSADAPSWVRLCPPSGSIPRPATFSGGKAVAGTNQDVCTDERPRAIHVYGVGAQDDGGRYFQMPGGGADSVSGGIFTARPFRFAGGDWDLTGSIFSPTSNQPSTAVYDPDLGVIWCMWGTRTYRVNPETLAVINTYTHDGAPYYGTANYVEANQHVLSFEGGQGGSIYLLVFATSAPGTVGYHRTGGGSGFVAISGTAPPSPGSKYYASAWDSIRGRLLIYNGGSRMFTLTPPGSGSWISGTWTWGELTCSTASYTPPADSGNGIFGRFFFDPDYNCAICQPSDVDDPLIVLPLEAV